jgi:microcystin-dependent protein
MSSPFVAEVRIFPFNFAPKGWAFCFGQLLPISQNTALFSLLGTTYGGDGRSTFALPNLQGCSPMQPGQGPGLTLRDLGETGGEETVTLLQTEMPIHSHTVMADTGAANSGDPTGNIYKTALIPGNPPSAVWAYNAGPPNTQSNVLNIGATGGSFPHNNLMPYLTLNFCIALQGVFPPRS